MSKSDLEKRQEMIEIASISKGVGRIYNEIARAPFAQSKSGRALIRFGHPLLIKAIEKERKALEKGARRDYEIPFLAIAPDRLAFLTLQAVFQGICDKKTGSWGAPMLSIAEMIGQWCEADTWYESATVREQRLFDAIKKRNRNPWNAKTRTQKKIKEYRELDWSAKDVSIKLGAALLEHAVKTGLLEKRHQTMDSTLVGLSEKAFKILDKFLTEQETFVLPYYLPAVAPPQPWKDGAGGGYLDLPLEFVKHVDDDDADLGQNLGDLRIPCEAVNAIQGTCWQFNRRLHEILHRAWELKKPKVAVGPFKRVKVPAPLPEDGTPPDLYRERKRLRRAAERQNKQTLVNKILMRCRLALARRLAKQEEIYFPHQIDWRGRAYSAPQIVHPHADDAGRALLEFREGKPLGQRGGYWLSVHLANLYGGLNKRPFAERVGWVRDQREAILDSADRPHDGGQFWAKADKPWRFLSAALEFARFAREGEGSVSQIPVAMDGTCNGLQHLSALGRDPEGGRWTNLVPDPHPQDLYQEVADRLRLRVEAAVSRGSKSAQPWLGIINRNLVKQAAMTTPYGVTRTGVADQIEELILGNDRFQDEEQAAWQLAGHLVAAIGEVVVKAAEIREWMRAVAKLFASQARSISWITPTGFRVVQDYRNVDRRVQTVAGTFKKRERDPQAKPNIMKHENSFVANVVHSLDASHMMLTVTELHRQGLRHFGMAHDSYAVHASDVDLMNQVLRDQFIRVHTEFTLAGLHEQLKRQAPDLEVPPPPSCGTLDLDEVRKSEYFFS